MAGGGYKRVDRGGHGDIEGFLGRIDKPPAKLLAKRYSVRHKIESPHLFFDTVMERRHLGFVGHIAALDEHASAGGEALPELFRVLFLPLAVNAQGEARTLARQ